MMDARFSGLFVFRRTGRWLSAIGLMTDGTWVDKRSGIAVDAPALTEHAYTLRAVTMAVISAGKRTRLDIVNADGLTLPMEVGKGYATIETLIRRRCGDQADALIAAHIGQLETLEAAA